MAEQELAIVWICDGCDEVFIQEIEYLRHRDMVLTKQELADD